MCSPPLHAPDLPPLARALWLSAISAYSWLLWRLWRTGLGKAYRWFTAFIAYHLARSLILSSLEPNTNLYALIWLGTAPVGWFVAVLTTLELYSAALKDFRGIATLGRRVMLIALGIAAAVSCLSLVPRIGHGVEPYPILAFFAYAERGINSSLLLFILLICAFLVSYPIPIKRNALVHAIVFSAYFLSSTMALLVVVITGHAATASLNTMMSGVTLASLLSWCVLLKPAGETVVRQVQSDSIESGISRLSSINALLINAGRCESGPITDE